jgi:hypothetical protein
LPYVRVPLSVFVVVACTVQFAPGKIGDGGGSKLTLGVAFEITKLPAARFVPALKFVVAPQFAVIA